MTPQAALELYIHTLERLTGESIDDLDHVCRSDVRFKDPLHDVLGRQAMKKVFAKLFRVAQDVNYFVHDHAVEGQHAFFHWRLEASLSGKPWSVDGITRVTFDELGQVSDHTEYWDAASQLYGRFPIVGTLLRFIRRRIADA